MAEIKRQVLTSTPLASGRLVRLSCDHKKTVPTKYQTEFPEMVVCEECTAIERAVTEHLERTEQLKTLSAGRGGFWN